MIDILSRRLRVRDDGTGNDREIDGTYAEFESEDAIIFLGDPGMGKTTFFKDAAKTNFSTVRNFLVAPKAEEGDVLFLDALDEYRTVARGSDVSSEIAKELCSLNKPKFRLSCRSADWFGSTDQEVLKVASASGQVVVLELCPLSREEILSAVQAIVPDPVIFIDEAESAGLGKLLGNPQTLELLARAWGTDKKPRNKFEAYEIGVSELIKEINPQHVVRSVTSPNPRDLRRAACAAFSTLLLSNSVGISRAEPADGDGFVPMHLVPCSNRGDLDAVLRRRLFFSTEVDRFEPTHRTIAEFLAAEDLANRIINGLPIDRVMAFICGIDGKPISSLRGLYAWLMCKIGHLAEGYVERDPYGVATYGDASILSPSAQCAIWAGLRQLRDPWFLANQEDRGSFRDLANLNTAKIIHELLKDPATGVHLKIAVLEAIANSTVNIGLNGILRAMVLEKRHNNWLRTTALRAFAKSVHNDWGQLDALDRELSQAADDLVAPEVRADLLSLTRAEGSVALRVLSIMEQAASAKKERHTFGHFYNLIDLPTVSDLNEILDGASRVLLPKNDAQFELRSIFYEWLKRRFESPTPITPIQLSNWLRNMRISRNNFEKTLASLKGRFNQEPSLFEKVFDLLAQMVPNKERSFGVFVTYDLWRLLPATVWPVTHCEFFLARAEKENDPERASELFSMYLSWLPKEGASVALAEAGFDFLSRRRDVEKALGNWNACKIEKWRKDEFKKRQKKRRKNSVTRTQNVAYFNSRLATIREGGEEHALAWAAMVYLGFNNVNGVADARERLISLTNEEITDAIIEGFIRNAENPNIPKIKAVIESWHANSSPYTHFLLCLSVFLRINAGMAVPMEALPHCIAVVVTEKNTGDKLPGYDEALTGWIFQEASQNPDVVKSVLHEIWVSATTHKKGNLPGFYDLSQDSSTLQFLASLSADVLRSGINDDSETVGKLVSVLMLNDQRATHAIGEAELARNGLSAEVRAIWNTALFMIDPNIYLEPWKSLKSEPDAALWKAIEVIKGGGNDKRGAVNITSAQRVEVIALVGKRFSVVGHPSDAWWGRQNPWDASGFVADQIKLLAADGSVDAGAQLERLENDDALISYRDLIRHHRAQHEKQQRESSFTFASPEQVAEAISNRVPATPSDLLAFVVDHLGVLAREMRLTQRERFRAYWNEEGRKLIKPKREEACSGLLAEDLQNRVKAQNLIVTVEHHMVADKECDLVILQGTERLLPIEVKHHYHNELWTAWRTQLDRLYTRDAMAGGLGIYLVIWSGEVKGRMMPKLPDGIKRPASVEELSNALMSLIPEEDRHRMRVIVVDISEP